MHFFLIGLGVLLALLVAARLFANADAKALARAIRKLGGYGLIAIAAVFAATGRFALAIPAGIMGFFLLRRASPIGMGFPGGLGGGQKTAGQQSRVRTDYLEMMLDHDTGTMDGVVLKGPYQGKVLSEIGLEGLIALWRECNREDQQSAQLLMAYLDRMEPDWRDRAGARAEAANDHGGAGGPITHEEAYDILGLEPGASATDIRKAHRTLMKKLHPDQGGSTYLAAKINEAKDLLLGE